MTKRLLCCLAGFALLASVSSPTPAKDVPGKKPTDYKRVMLPVHEPLPPDIRAWAPQPARSAAAGDTTLLASYTFDDASGQPDTQGWTTFDKTQQLDDFFHVADGTELDGGMSGALVPLEGDQSMWCGVAPSTSLPFSGWATLPGYGNSWDQRLTSTALACDSIHISYKVSWDCEEGYDFAFLEYSDTSAAEGWSALDVNGGVGYYDGTGSLVESFGFSVADPEIQIRFRFESDGAWSDEDGLWDTDGAILVDSITVRCYSGGKLSSTHSEDFESALPGEKSAGIWTAERGPGYGDFAALYPGFAVLQQDECVVNGTFLWGFFDDPAVTNYGCGGFPDQGAVPGVNDDGLYINNEIWSPRIALGGTGEVLLEYSIYEDGPSGGAWVFPWWRVRSWVGDTPGPWRESGFLFIIPRTGWSRRPVRLNLFMDPGATHIQVALGLWDGCPNPAFCYSLPPCRSNAPLYDDVRVSRISTVGPQFGVFAHRDPLFQDNFATDGTLTGTARADMAENIARTSPTIQPGDSITITVSEPNLGLGSDPHTGVGPAVYAYVSVWPQGQSGKSAADLEAPETRSIGKRYPHVTSVVNNGVTWHCFRMDTVFYSSGGVYADQYAFDLNDSVFTPGDTICYVFAAEDAAGNRNYWSRRWNGQGDGFETDDLAEALASPLEFTILPAGGWRRGGNILYVDATDDRGGPAQLFFDSAFDLLGIRDLVDRYDVLAPSRRLNNTPASRVVDIQKQIVDCYQTILWNTGRTDAIGDGGYRTSDDFGLLLEFLDQHVDKPGVYFSGDRLASNWSYSIESGAAALRATYMNFDLDHEDHVDAGEPMSPTLTAVGSCFIHGTVPDELVALGGCPFVSDFDLLTATGLSNSEFVNTATGKQYVLSQATPNTAGSTARVILSGFSFHSIRDAAPGFPPARVEHLKDIITWLGNSPPTPTGVDPVPQLANYLDANYPNPFNPTTTIKYGIRVKGHVSLQVYNAAGQLVKTLVNGVQTPQPGGFAVSWNGDNDAGSAVASGVYFYRLVTGSFSQTKKMVLLK